MRLVQIVENKAHWIFDPIELFGTKDLSDRFPPDCVFIDITDKPTVQEGWDYNKETGEFTEPIIPEPIPEPIPQPTETEILMQSFAGLELQNLEIQQGQQLLAQQLTDLELALPK